MSTTQPEWALEDKLIKQLVGMGYQKVKITDESGLIENLKTQIEIHNSQQLSGGEFKQILNYIAKGNVFERAKILRDRVPYTNEQGEGKSIELLNKVDWCKNQFQVTHQVRQEGKYKNRYDVTILINGLPLVQIELKRRGGELAEAFNQIQRYGKHSFDAGQGLFQFVQLFVISNGVNTKYYANNSVAQRSFEQTFFWSDKENVAKTQLTDFADDFLDKCHLAKMISRYIVLNETMKCLMVLRPYQYFATEAIIDMVQNQPKRNGYIWHTTGSGKTLTSFKASQVICSFPKVKKVIFVVDRQDLDSQTVKEFNSFQKDSVTSTTSTKKLADNLLDPTKPLVVTTMQKLGNVIGKEKYRSKIEALSKERVIFIFDECHRSQFGDTHTAIKRQFTNSQLFGFTGTPIFEDNAVSKQGVIKKTSDLFDKELHKYIITDAIRDGNVLKFSVEYIRTFKRKEETVDIEVEAIDEDEVMDAPKRLESIVQYITQNHSKKTHGQKYTSIFCVSSVANLIAYYDIFKREKEAGNHNLKVATVFSYDANEKDQSHMALSNTSLNMAAEESATYHTAEVVCKHSREKLDEFIGDYNITYATLYSSNDIYKYKDDISRKVKHKQIDILLVVNMFLTGFDSKTLNTLYVDKNLKYHGLIQAFSRTNRIETSLKSQGEIVCFRNLKEATDEAILLFSNKDANATNEILMKPYEVYQAEMKEAVDALKELVPEVDNVNELHDEEQEAEFVKAFREVMKLKNILESFSNHDAEELPIAAQEFEDYKSKYLDLHDRVKRQSEKEKVSILDEIDFQLELIQKDEINVAYILRLLATIRSVPEADEQKRRKDIERIIAGEVSLRSKKELIEKFIEKHLPHIEDLDLIHEAFDDFIEEERVAYIQDFANDEALNEDGVKEMISQFQFSNKEPQAAEISSISESKIPLKERKARVKRVVEKVKKYMEVLVNGI